MTDSYPSLRLVGAHELATKPLRRSPPTYHFPQLPTRSLVPTTGVCVTTTYCTTTPTRGLFFPTVKGFVPDRMSSGCPSRTPYPPADPRTSHHKAYRPDTLHPPYSDSVRSPPCTVRTGQGCILTPGEECPTFYRNDVRSEDYKFTTNH